MKKNLFLLLLSSILLLSGSFFSVSQAQQAVLSTSNNAEAGNGSVSYSVGQTAYLTQSGISGFIIEGVQQPYEIQFFPGIEERNENELKCLVFPNPTNGEVTLKIEKWKPTDFRYRISDNLGNIMSEKPVESAQQVIPMGSLSSGTYIFTILGKNIPLKTYKIIKR